MTTTQTPSTPWVRAQHVRRPRRVRRRPGVYRSRGSHNTRRSVKSAVWEVVKDVVAGTVFTLVMVAFVVTVYAVAVMLLLM